MKPLHGTPIDISSLPTQYTDTRDRGGSADPLANVFEIGSTTTSVDNGQLVETVAANAAEGVSPPGLLDDVLPDRAVGRRLT